MQDLPLKELGASNVLIVLCALHRFPRFHDMGDGGVVHFFDHGSLLLFELLN